MHPNRRVCCIKKFSLSILLSFYVVFLCMSVVSVTFERVFVCPPIGLLYIPSFALLVSILWVVILLVCPLPSLTFFFLFFVCLLSLFHLSSGFCSRSSATSWWFFRIDKCYSHRPYCLTSFLLLFYLFFIVLLIFILLGLCMVVLLW